MKYCNKCGQSFAPTMVMCTACGSKEFSDMQISKQRPSNNNSHIPNSFDVGSIDFKNKKNTAYAAGCVFCILAILPLPYWYYDIFLRLLVTFVAILSAMELYKQNNNLWLLFTGVAILFNPLFKVYLTKGLWVPVDLLVAGAFAWMIVREKSI